jgi:hypothetical protein
MVLRDIFSMEKRGDQKPLKKRGETGKPNYSLNK